MGCSAMYTHKLRPTACYTGRAVWFRDDIASILIWVRDINTKRHNPRAFAACVAQAACPSKNDSNRGFPQRREEQPETSVCLIGSNLAHCARHLLTSPQSRPSGTNAAGARCVLSMN